MDNDIKAIVIPGRASGAADNRPHAFSSFAAALAFIKSIKCSTVIVEFGVETDTLDFYDAVKALGLPVIFSANPLGAAQFSQFGIRAADVVYPESQTQPNRFADYRPRPGIKGSYPRMSLIISRALVEA